MIARIRTNKNEIYDTIVFAIIHNQWKSKIIGFNKDCNKLEYIDIFRNHKSLIRNVFIIDSKMKDWVKEKDIEGYYWIINDKKLLKKIKKKKEINEELFSKCKELQSEVCIKEWNSIESYDDIENILTASIGFHETIIERIERKSENEIVEVKFNNPWGCNIIIRFEDEVDFKCVEGYGDNKEIIMASLFFDNGYIYWVDNELYTSEDMRSSYYFFKSKKAAWKIDI